MWRNRPGRALVDRLRELNEGRAAERKAGFYRLDVHSLPSSMDAVIDFAARPDEAALKEVRRRYGCVAPWVDRPARYGALARTPALDSCADEVAAVVEEMLLERMSERKASDRALFDALVWSDESHGVEPLFSEEIDAIPATYPLAL